MAASFSLGPGRKASKGRQDGSYDQLAISMVVLDYSVCAHVCMYRRVRVRREEVDKCLSSSLTYLTFLSMNFTKVGAHRFA